MIQILEFIGIIFVAAAVQAATGFGFPIVCLSVLTLMFPYSTSVALVQAIAAVSTTYLTIKYRKSIVWGRFLPLLIPTILISTIFTVVSVKASADVMFLILGAMLVVVSIYSMIFSSKIKIKASLGSGLGLGTFCGITSGLTSICGPPAALYLLAMTDDKDEYLGCMQCIFACSNLVNLIIRIFMGSLEFGHIKFVTIGWAAMLLGTFVGQIVYKKMDTTLFKKVIYVFIGLNGLYTIITHL